MAIMRAIQLTRKDQNLTIVTDSMSSIQCIESRIIDNQETVGRSLDKNKILNGDILEIIKDEIFERGEKKIKFQWIEAHTNLQTEDHINNNIVDGLAKAATYLDDKNYPPITRKTKNRIKISLNGMDLDGNINQIMRTLEEEIQIREWENKTSQKRPENSGKEYNKISNLKRYLQGFAIKLRTNTLPTLSFLKKTMGIENDSCPFCRRYTEDTWKHWTNSHSIELVYEMKSKIESSMETEVTKYDLNCIEYNDWIKMTETGVIDEESAKKLRKIMRGDPREYKKKDKKFKKKSESIFTKRLKQIHNIIIGYSKEMWVDRTQAIENYLKTWMIREEINKAKKEANKKRKDKINAKREIENQEIDTELRDLQEDSDQSEEEEEETRDETMETQ
jgi:ribonuclease HI